MAETELAAPAIFFLATGKSGLGHLRRVATVARAVRRMAPTQELRLVSNALPDGLAPEDVRAFDGVELVERCEMAGAVPRDPAGVVVLDTVAVPGIEWVPGRRVLILREAPETEVARFRLAGGQAWDQIIVANPREHWMPDETALPASAVLPVGWIYRSAGPRKTARGPLPTVLVATGGGGTADTARGLYAGIDAMLAQVRGGTRHTFHVLQAIGPRARGFGRLDQADAVIDPGPHLNAFFRAADVVISTAGYNSVLELATTDTPALLVPIPRSIDDQAARARVWGGRLGAWADEARPDGSVAWLLQQIERPARRAPVDLGESGEDRAAAAILSLT